MLGAGCAAWVYSKIMHQTGGNVKNSLIVAGIAAFFAFAVVVFVLSSLLHV